VDPGTYQVTEATNPDHDLTAINCDDTDSTGSIGERRATIRVAEGESVRCTFVNTKLPPPGAGGALLVVANAGSLGAGDTAVRARLEGLGYTVTIRSQTATAADAAGQDVVLISSSVASTAVSNRFRALALPVIVWEHAIFDDMGMTQTTLNTHYGVSTGQRTVAIRDSAHPLAAGLSGTPTLTTSNQTFTWGVPGAAAANVAAIATNPARSTVFGYTSGAQMFGLTAPARRVGLYLHDATAANLTADGGRLFDAAVQWADSN
jgi:hypothetical protein